MAKRPKLKKRQSKKPHRRNSLPAIATLSAGTSQRRAIPIPRGRRPSMAALTDRARERRSAKYCGRLPAVSDLSFHLRVARRMRQPPSSGNYIVGHDGFHPQGSSLGCLRRHESWPKLRFELRNVVANYLFERSHRFVGIQPNSGFGAYSRLSCGVGDTKLGRRPGKARLVIR